MKVVYNSFSGRYSDNPRPIYERLAARARPGDEHLWLVDPRHEHGFPAGVPRVRIDTPECRQALEQADVVVSNVHLEMAWDKPATGRYLQTWHGTPLKHIHFDVRWAPEGRLDRLTVDVRRWDALLSPNAASTGPLRGAFSFEGDLAETGYPRNDVLSAPDRDARRDRVREALGIAPGTPVVLYTPTWRDDLVTADGEQDFALHLDLDELTRRLPDHVVLLRLHYMLSGRLAVAGGLGGLDPAKVRDVSLHPEISDLYLAADVMVTDYSSTMFDFAVTGKPMVFYTYDLADYRDRLRGFYFDFTEHAPGPLLATSTEVVDALADLAGVSAASAPAYARFRERFCHLEDGQATDRVLDRYFPETPGQEVWA